MQATLLSVWLFLLRKVYSGVCNSAVIILYIVYINCSLFKKLRN